MKGRILVVIDEPNLRETFHAILTEADYESVQATDFDSAIDELSRCAFDAVFADIVYGAKTGIDILREVKKREFQAQVVIIAGQVDMVTAGEAVRLGAFDYVPKPVTKTMLLRIADHALRHKHAVDARETYRRTLEATFKCVNDAILAIDARMTILTVSDAVEKFLQRSSGDILGRHLPDVVSQSQKPFLLDVAEKTLHNAAMIQEYPAEWICPDGRPQTVLISCTPLVDSRSMVPGAVLVLRDITRALDLEDGAHERRSFRAMIGKSKRMQEIYDLLDALADTETSVLVTGESGTGKELVADALHAIGPRSAKPLIKINCSALSENLLESELFGHVKGAFTGAIKDKVGRFEMADGGTVFLDEIGDLSPNVQVKLLRFLQQKEFERVGDTRSIKVNVRVIAATHRNLMDRVEQGSFRKDLYYRLKVVEVLLPSLRERREDIPLLVEHFRARFVLQFHKKILHVSEDVYKTFLAYSWPGNIRELEHVMEHAFVVCDGAEITTAHLPQELCLPSPSIRSAPVKATVTHCSEDAVRRALEKTAWNKAKAARILGVGRQTLYRKLIEYNIAEPADE
ncbi:MAG: sigma 54-interacting transcriptional regulator [Deltaproteobacteria bacterium]|nr:sigma 54-interacting transcriptional regulator [Deltaproteobacteria bacterium]